MIKVKEIKAFLKENNITGRRMDAMWAYMYDKNSIIKNLTDCKKSWVDLNTLAMKDLIKRYNMQELPENFNLMEWFDSWLVAQKLSQHNENKNK